MTDKLAPVAPADKIDRVPVPLGVKLTTLDEAWRLAKHFAASPLVPEDYRNKPENVLVAIQLGAEIGLAPMQALQSICVINGKPSLYGDGLLAVIQTSPLYANHAEYYDVDGVRREHVTKADLERDDTAAVCTFWRKGHLDPTTRRFSVADAKLANLWRKPGPWQSYPSRMLRMRARSWAARDTFADVLRGLHAAEEVMDERSVEPPEPRKVPRLSTAAADDLHAFVDRTNATRHDDSPATLIRVGPSRIAQTLEHHLPPDGGHDGETFWTVTLDTGEILETIHASAAVALAPFVATDQRLVFGCTQDGEALELVEWTLAE